MKTPLTILITLLMLEMNASLACQCEELDSTRVINLFEESEYVLEGQYYMTLSKNREQEKILSHEGVGTEILFKVTNTYKGMDSLKVVTLVQYSGDCSRNFRRGGNYLIFGYDVQFKETKDNRIPPVPPFKTKGVVTIEMPDKEMDYWKEKSNGPKMIFTNSCHSWELSTKKGQLVERLIK